eukprot:5270548-Amphidinium_carterae.1
MRLCDVICLDILGVAGREGRRLKSKALSGFAVYISCQTIPCLPMTKSIRNSVCRCWMDVAMKGQSVTEVFSVWLVRDDTS